MRPATIAFLFGLIGGAAHAGDDDPIALSALPAPPAPAVAPKLRIVSPAMDAVMTGKRTRSADSKFDNLECLQDAKTFSIKIAAENWPVKRGGPGVLLVVDGVYATVLHDLTKPVRVAELEPYERELDTGSWATYGPMFACGEHWIVVMPTTADGRMLRVPPVVSWWRSVSAEGDPRDRDEEDGHRESRMSRALPIVNWPLLGSLYIGRSWAQTEDVQRSGWVLSDPKRPVLDWTTAPGSGTGTPCELSIAAQDDMQSWHHKTAVPAAGTITLPSSFVDRALAFSVDECGGGLIYYAKLWAKKPPPVDALAWPVPGSSQAEDYWHSAEGHAQFKQHVKSQREKCDKGEGDCQFGRTKPKPRR